jgi:hypothetical protein
MLRLPKAITGGRKSPVGVKAYFANYITCSDQQVTLADAAATDKSDRTAPLSFFYK